MNIKKKCVIFALQLITSIVGSAQHALHLSIHLAVEERDLRGKVI